MRATQLRLDSKEVMAFCRFVREPQENPERDYEVNYSALYGD
jgi:hypothetical protein